MKTALVLPAEHRARVAHYAKDMLSAAGALGRVPTPLDEVAAALKLSDPQDFSEFEDMPRELVTKLRRLTRTARGAFDVRARTIYIARDQPVGQQRFTLGHEIGHSLPWHKDAFYCDDSSSLDPLTRDELEAEASALSAELIYNLGEFTDRAHSSRLHIATAVNLADAFGASRHSGIRRYVEDAPGTCALLELVPSQLTFALSGWLGRTAWSSGSDP